ncbi:FimV/HubP family polar landmark protein [Marinobacterium stanieri]|uniref:Pilus assembly protein FimV n=1 Tax=Marinobacterium stanieri TaxID=49186 RepID=A0A1N6PUB5_9GAMM|nr:FimV/HubP family polar landmark protein [Marinobacterium stanieri]SIQ07941.1 pilus assembly protein FimV [Marinobacterium stanieri]
MLRKLALSLAVSAALGVSHANALGLGEIRVNSALNEPLDAEIRLTQVRDLSPLQIQPRMASLDEYSVGSSELGRYLRDIQFQVLVSPEGAGRILLRSSEPVQEPFLNFMVEVNWPSGRLVREYTLLLDPPVFDTAPTVRTSPAVSASVSVTETALPELKPASPAVNANNARTRAGEGQVYVGVNDTLWDLAKRNKPAGVTEHQMMLALMRKNPQAFPSGNINAMKAGVVMDVPNKAEAGVLSHREAVAEVARQMKLWRDGKAGMISKPAPVDVSKQPAQNGEAADNSATADEGGDASANASVTDAGEQSKLTIVAPDEQASESDASAPAGESVDSSAEEGAAAQDTEQTITDVSSQLENEVLVAQEKIDVLERENADLNDKLNSVLEQLESQTRMLELQSQQMATLQAEMSRQDEAAKSQSPLDTVMENPTLLGGIGAGALAILAGLWLALRRRGADKPEKSKPDLVNVPDNLKERDEPEVPSAAVAAGAAGVAAGAALAADDDDSDELPKHAPLSDEEDDDFTRPAMQSLAPEEEQADLGDDLQSLDLDMDLDLDDLDAQDDVDDNLSDTVSELDAAEFDLGVEEPEASEADMNAEDDALEFPTANTEETSEPVADVDEELEFKVAPLSAEEDQDSDLDALLGGDDTSDDLDFMLVDNDQPTEATDETIDGDDELEALFGASSEEARVEAAADEDDNPVADSTLHETVEPLADDDYEIDSELDAMLAGSADDDEDDAVDLSGFEADSAEDDLDSLLADFDPVSEDDGADELQLRNPVEEELTSNISHDLEMDLDSEVDEMLNSTDDEIELSEERNDEAVEILDKMNLLSGTDETETKLDLARAYLEMDDREGARDILQEITSEGSQSQREQAQKLLDTLG